MQSALRICSSSVAPDEIVLKARSWVLRVLAKDMPVLSNKVKLIAALVGHDGRSNCNGAQNARLPQRRDVYKSKLTVQPATPKFARNGVRVT